MATLKGEVEAGNVKFMAAFEKQDAAAIGALYTEDCKIMPTGADTMSGKEAVAQVFSGVMKMGAAKVELAVDEVGPMGSVDTVYERSHYTFYDKDNKVMDHGKYVVIWKRIERTLYLHIDIFNSNNPPS